MTVGAIVPAAGRGERMGAPVPKAFMTLAGEPLVTFAVRSLRAAGVPHIVVAAPTGFDDSSALDDVTVVPGGETRQESVRQALAALPADVDVVLVHDAARPLTPVELIRSVMAAVGAGASAVVPVLPVTDTIKRVDAGGFVEQSLDRSSLRAVQTPQGFRREVLEAAYAGGAGGAGTVTDDAGLVEAIGVKVKTVPGSEYAFKVTLPLDRQLAEAVLAERGHRVL